MSIADCEKQLGERGRLRVNGNNYRLVRKWCSAMGLPGKYSAALAYGHLAYCYNGRNGNLNAGIDWHKKEANNAGMVAGNDEDEADANDMPITQEDRDDMAREIHNPAPIRRPAAGGLDAAIEAIVEDVISRRGMDTAAIVQIVRQEIAGVAPRAIVVKHDGMPDINIAGHIPPWFERVLKLLVQGRKDNVNVCLVGPAGCGKTHVVPMLAKALNCTKHTIVSGSAGVSESAITGRLLPTGEHGRFEYSASEFVECFESGNALICLDEIDAFDRNMLMIVNMPTANGHMYVPHRMSKPLVERGENVFFLATANTYGTSANPVYTARDTLDAATTDRWIFVTVDYDTKFEESAALSRGLTAHECSKLWELRTKVRETGLRRVISTRAFLKAATMRAIGDSWQVVMDTLTAGWTKDEKAKVGLVAA
jgi:MoxR-like ATPase